MLSFASDSTIHGVNFIFGEGRNKFVRILWFFVLLSSFCGFCFYFKYSYEKFTYSPDIAVKMRDRKFKDFPMPAITFCPRLLINDYYKQYLSAFRKEDKPMNSSACKHLAANYQWCPINVEPFCSSTIGDFDDVNVFEEFTKSDSIIVDALNKNPKMPQVFTHDGVCYSFNMEDVTEIYNMHAVHDDFQLQKNDEFLKGEWTAEKGFFTEDSSCPLRYSSANDFKFYIHPVSDDIVCETSVNVFVHLPNEVPNDSHKLFKVGFESKATLKITVKSFRTDDALRAYSPDIRKCYFEGERKLEFFKIYSKAHCEFECYTNVTIKACGCVPFYMPRNKTTQICKYSQLRCIAELKYIYRDESRPTCDCLPSCNDVKYEVEFIPLDETQVEWRFNGTRILVLSTRTVVEEIESFLTYKIQNLISDIGGLLGLFLGCSLLSIFEIIFIVVTSCAKAFQRKNRVESEIAEETKVPLDQEMKKLKQDFNHLVSLVENILKSEVMKKVENLDQNVKELSRKISNLEKNALILSDF